MRIPQTAPNIFDVVANRRLSAEQLLHLIMRCAATDSKGRYLHWDKLRYLKPPSGLTAQEYWVGCKMARSALLKALPLRDKRQQPFKFALPDPVLRMLYQIEEEAKYFSGKLINLRPWRDQYLVHSLIEEAISSSQLEGAKTTRQHAQRMLHQGRAPHNLDEQMIFNNYQAMHFVRRQQEEQLTPLMILELHRLVTEKTLDDANAAGRLRTEKDHVQVISQRAQEILHTPPPADELPARLQELCDFANQPISGFFIHPIIKAILLHFMLAYDHPFVDGNGRTARALFYWAMIKDGYWFSEFISISQIIKNAPVQYGRAFLWTETDDNDTTYFIIHQLEVIQKAIEQLKTELSTNTQELAQVEHLLEDTSLAHQLNYRQLSLLKHALKHPNTAYTIKEHQASHRISYQTARTDLLKMANELGLLQQKKIGKSFIFVAPQDLRERIKSL